jgi:probable HAF family extracellular repeat protein
MSRRIMKLSLILSLLALVCAPSLRLMAQDTTTQQESTDKGVESKSPSAQRRYILKDLGTLGGPRSTVGSFAKVLNNRGMLVGDADTSIPDPFAPNCLGGPNCLVSHGFKWENGIKTDLGTLPGGSSSDANWINELGQITGRSQNGLIDPLTGMPATVAVLWQANGTIINLGDLGGHQGLAVGINNSSQVIGVAANTIPDDFSLGGVFGLNWATQTRAFLWQHGVMRDLGTLGGPDAFAEYVNDRGQVAGFSYADSTPNDTTGIPTVHAFIWENNSMTDLGSLGGTLRFPNDINSQGQVIGIMTLAGDESQHPFLWDRGRLIDLGTFGGSNGDANWMNDAGEVVGRADFPGDMVRHAFSWRDDVKTDLGPPPGDICTNAFGINSEGQVVGTSGVCHGAVHAVLWVNGQAIDLNTVIPANSSLQLVYALSINDRGEIAGIGVPPGVPVQDVETNGHAFLLIPVNSDQDDDQYEDTTKADSRSDQQSREAGQNDPTDPTTVPQNNTVAGETVAPPRARQVDEDQIRDNRYGRFLRLRLPVRKDD